MRKIKLDEEINKELRSLYTSFFLTLAAEDDLGINTDFNSIRMPDNSIEVHLDNTQEGVADMMFEQLPGFVADRDVKSSSSYFSIDCYDDAPFRLYVNESDPQSVYDRWLKKAVAWCKEYKEDILTADVTDVEGEHGEPCKYLQEARDNLIDLLEEVSRLAEKQYGPSGAFMSKKKIDSESKNLAGEVIKVDGKKYKLIPEDA